MLAAMADLDSFREETRRWLLSTAPASMRAPAKGTEDYCWGGKRVAYPSDVLRWRDAMAERGWTAPTWPREYGGGGLSGAEARVLSEEMASLSLRAPLVGFGLMMIGPLLLQEGSDAQRREHLPPIVRGEIRWCQGYSEPGAGSDLASLRTRAEADGEELVINGQKIWTSGGDKSDWMFLLVRTDASARKQDGITFVLLDLTTPGVSVRPIRLISGASPFCETFFTDVRVPGRNVVGERNRGWALARALLGHERSAVADVFRERDDATRLIAAARRELGELDGRIADGPLRDRIAQLEIDQACFDGVIDRLRAQAQASGKPGHESSILKYYGTELNERRRDLAVAVLGPRALGWEGPGFEEAELKATRDWLRSRGNTIEGGTSEIQLNIIAKRVLGLPEA
jgi:alkylation response protein AidB-like acyl-CoA dehydrogenase